MTTSSSTACLRDRTEYAKNPLKTAGGELISSFECSPETVDAEFALAKREYRALTGRTQERDVIAYQVRRSFRPGEVTPEEANRIGYELAARFLKGQHAFIVATHVDKTHVHNHIIWNSTTLDCTRKFRDFIGSGMAIRRLSDLICMEHHLSVVAVPKGSGKSYDKWLGDQAKPTHRELLRQAIDDAMEQKPQDFGALLKLLQSAGWEVKRGKHAALRGPGEKRFKRIDSLGEGYDEATLRAVIAGERAHCPRKRTAPAKEQSRVSLLIDI